MIHELHQSLLSETVFFSCSATLNVKAENAVKKFEDFHEKRTDVGQFKIICTSVNQSDIFICVFSILKKKMSSYEQLYFLLNQAVLPSSAIFLQNSDGGQAVKNSAAPVSASSFKNSQNAKSTFWQISKTIVFMNDRTKIASVINYLKR